MSSGYAPFDEYYHKFRTLIRDINQQLQSESPGTAGAIIPQLRQCEEVLLQMRVEARGAKGSSLKRELMDICQACEQQLASYQTIHQQKEELFGNAATTTTTTIKNNSDKERLLAARGRVESQNSQLEGALRSIRETEALAGEIGQELGRNRESINRAKGNVGELSGMMKQAKGHLKSLSRKWF
jgi:chromosome segregation ATPase